MSNINALELAQQIELLKNEFLVKINFLSERVSQLEKEAGELNSPEKLFLEMINNLIIKIDKENFPNSIFFFKEDKFMFEIENSTIWCNYHEVWGIFEKQFSNDYGATKGFIKEMFEKHFKMKGVTAQVIDGKYVDRFEKHFKIKK